MSRLTCVLVTDSLLVVCKDFEGSLTTGILVAIESPELETHATIIYTPQCLTVRSIMYNTASGAGLAVKS